MKILKPVMLLVIALMVNTAVKANKTDEGVLTKTHAIDTYVDAMMRGKLEGLNDVIDPTAKFSLLQKKHLVSYTKKEMMDFLNTTKNIEEDCTVNTSVVETDTDIAVVKVDMQFKTFVRSNYVTIANTGNGWKIINVYSVFN
ncbi:nuclear transport factor 2 family protein [Mucilaginibacter sp. X5P1]|uniref:nuclear transport factor 2 family protein n=1 Tax=Mucilaginibacter sp. X5P1 TaxID=2723088 RepID=UPI0016155C28|nr:nuclear transport factor 2 family protein [Mucilaginibacter sp. X5P1]MBB6140278.1 hypothetical protein [Mucilaginibacter sp. X5P1]